MLFSIENMNKRSFQFQGGAEGPNPNTQTINAELTCSSSGTWEYEGTSVTEVSCELIPPPCSTCEKESVTLVSGDLTPTATNPTAGSDNCVSMTVTCDASGTTGATTTMTVCCLVL